MNANARKKLRSTKKFLDEVYKPHSTAQIPVNFDVEEYNQYLPPEANKKKAEEAYWFILDRIISENDRQGYGTIPKYCKPVPINHTIVKEVFGNGYKNYFKALRKCKVIALNQKGRAGISCSRYYFGEKYRSQAVRTVNHSPKIVAKIKRSFDRHLQENEEKFLSYAHLIYWLTTGKLSINKEVAIKYDQKIEKEIRKKLIASGDSKKLASYDKATETRRLRTKAAISVIENNKHYIKIDRNRRLHTVLTSMPEWLRCYLRYDGQELIAVDISNSQPFHFCYFFEKVFWSTQKGACSLKSIHPGLYKSFEESNQLTMIRQQIKATEKHDDVYTFLHKAKSGKIYEELTKKYGLRYPSLNTRAKTKKEFITFLNFDLANRRHPKYGAYRQFARDFPDIASLMELVKKSNYKDISTILQMFEAKMFLVKCGRKFSDFYPEAPLFSIHDTMITWKSHQKQLEEIISQTYQEHFGFSPKVKSSELNQQTAYNNIQKHINKAYTKLFPNE